MQLHGNARTTPYIRREMVRRVRERAEPVTETAVVASTIASRGSRAGLADSDDTEVLSESDPKRASPRF